jgi:hypothetical protein
MIVVPTKLPVGFYTVGYNPLSGLFLQKDFCAEDPKEDLWRNA